MRPARPNWSIARRVRAGRPSALPDEGRQTVERETPLERALHAIWSASFAGQQILACNDFFEGLSGHSFKAARLVSAVRALPGLAGASFQDLYDEPAIRGLAARLGWASQAGLPHETGGEETFTRISDAKRRL